MRFRAERHAAILALFALAGAGSARAEERIGNTAVARNSVSKITVQAAAPIQVGDDVFADENVRTGVESAAKFIFSDETNLAMGPTSTIKLDRFVYRTDTSYAKAAVNFAAGAFRFTTGGSDKKAYELKTSTATIGVRGTIFDVLVRNGRTTVTLIEGNIVVCPRGRYDGDPRTLSAAQVKKFDCKDLRLPGQTAVVSSRSASLKAVPFSFAGSVGLGNDDLLSDTKFAANGDYRPGVTDTAALNTPLDANDPALCYARPDFD